MGKEWKEKIEKAKELMKELEELGVRNSRLVDVLVLSELSSMRSEISSMRSELSSKLSWLTGAVSIGIAIIVALLVAVLRVVL